MRLLEKHNHALDTSSLSESDMLERLRRLNVSLSTHYPGIVREFAAFGSTQSNRTARKETSSRTPLLLSSFKNQELDSEHNVPTTSYSAGRAGTGPIRILPAGESFENEDFHLYTPGNLKTEHPREWEPQTEEGRSDLQAQMTEAIRGHMQSVNISVEGADIVREIKHIVECFGYRMRIRRSSYIHGEDEDEKGRKQLQKADFECPHGEDRLLQLRCRFNFSVFTDAKVFFGGTEEELERIEDLDKFYSARFQQAWHNHPPSADIMKRTLPPLMLKEALVMRNKSMISTADIIRHLEDKFGFQLNRHAVSRQLRWQKRKAHPADLDCQLLIQNLLEYCNNLPEMFAKTRIVEQHTLHSVCWSFPEWREDFMKYGVVPGVSIDAKALANCYNIPLVTICGRSSNGSLCLFFMGFIPSEDMEGFSWMIDQFLECMGVSPRLWACDQDFAIIGAIKESVPDALIILDDWHLNKNQLKNTRKWDSAGREISNDLYALRHSMTHLEFTTRRKAFEEKHFPDGDLPKWFTSLYHYNAELVVKCYNRTTCGPRFFFQGSGYAESANAVYRKVVMKREVRMAQVPGEMRRYYRIRLQERTVQERSDRFKYNKWKLIVALYSYDDDMWNKVVDCLMPAALQYFFDHSIKQALRYVVRSRIYIEHEAFGRCVEFEVTAETPREHGPPIVHRVVCPLEAPEEPFVAGLCSCSWHKSTGIPCRHAVRVATLLKAGQVSDLPAGTKMPDKFPLHSMFHVYWRRDRKGWTEEDILAAREGQTTDIQNEDDPVFQEGNEEEDGTMRKARTAKLASRFFCNGRAAWNKVHLCMVSKGLTAMRKMGRMMELLTRAVDRNTETEDIDIITLVRSVAASLETEEGTGRQPRDVSLEKASEIGIQNANQGRVKGRGTRKRARSWTEKRSGKKKKQNYGAIGGIIDAILPPSVHEASQQSMLTPTNPSQYRMIATPLPLNEPLLPVLHHPRSNQYWSPTGNSCQREGYPPAPPRH